MSRPLRPAPKSVSSRFHQLIASWTRFMAVRSRALHHPSHRGRHAIPVRGFFFERSPAERAQTVKLRAAVVVRGPPLGAHPAANLEPMKRGIERAFHDAQHVVGRALNRRHDAVPVHFTAAQHLENQHVERARQQLSGFLCSHKRFRDDTAAGLPVKRAIGALAVPASRNWSMMRPGNCWPTKLAQIERLAQGRREPRLLQTRDGARPDVSNLARRRLWTQLRDDALVFAVLLLPILQIYVQFGDEFFCLLRRDRARPNRVRILQAPLRRVDAVVSRAYGESGGWIVTPPMRSS